MLSILVCHSYFLRLDQKQRERAKPYPPLATLQAAEMLRREGHRVSFFDAMLADGCDEFDRTLGEVQPQIVVFYEDTFNFLSKMCLGVMRHAACDMIAAARNAGARVIAAGPDVTDAAQPYLQAGAEVALLGEGLAALLYLIRHLDDCPDAPVDELTDGVYGVRTSRGEPARMKPGGRILPVAQHPGVAAWDLVDMDRYRELWMKAHGFFSLNMAASRGCSFRCSWCAKPTWGNHYLQRPAADVVQELAHLKRNFRPDHIWFADDIFGFRADWLAEFAASVGAQDAMVPFTIQTRADLIREQHAWLLRQAGCKEAWIGAESGSQRILDSMNKGTTLAQIRSARASLAQAGIRVGFFIQLGYLGEELPDILATRELIATARPDDIGVSVSYPLPGTKFFDLVKAGLGAKTHWRESNDLDMMFRGTYTSDFYRGVRNLLHEQADLGRPADSRGRNVMAESARDLERRWALLLGQEFRYRSAGASSSCR